MYWIQKQDQFFTPRSIHRLRRYRLPGVRRALGNLECTEAKDDISYIPAGTPLISSSRSCCRAHRGACLLLSSDVRMDHLQIEYPSIQYSFFYLRVVSAEIGASRVQPGYDAV